MWVALLETNRAAALIGAGVGANVTISLVCVVMYFYM